MNRNSPQAKDNPELYNHLLVGDKNTSGPDFCITRPKPSRMADWKFDMQAVEHVEQPHIGMSLHVEVKNGDTENFKFLLFADEFMSAPLVNFDAKNATHRNKKNVPLAKQWVSTPHFNRYDDNGRRFAYKTSALLNPVSAAQLTNVNACIIHFYEEFNIHHSPTGFPSVTFRQPSQTQLFPVPTFDDPLANVTRF